uniref:NACHT LRR and PYD domain-containing protein n=1 Tax=Pundamilia nyererei TaxID=303518 RepID=A0A3B4FL05_9CICH
MITKVSSRRSINLFYCLSELNDSSLVEEIQKSLRSGRLSTNELTPAHWSALVFILLLDQNSLTSACCQDLSSVLSTQSSLRTLSLNYNKLQDSAVKLLSDGLSSPQCKLQILGLSFCFLSSGSCGFLASVFSNQPSSLRELDMSHNSLRDSGVKQLCVGLQSRFCRLETLRSEFSLLRFCGLTEKSCEFLGSLLSSKACHLKVVNLSANKLLDSGAMRLSAELQSPDCQIKSLSNSAWLSKVQSLTELCCLQQVQNYSGCWIREKGCISLASALTSNPFSLKELDLSYNCPGDLGAKLLSAKLKDPQCSLETLRYKELFCLVQMSKHHVCELTHYNIMGVSV